MTGARRIVLAGLAAGVVVGCGGGDHVGGSPDEVPLDAAGGEPVVEGAADTSNGTLVVVADASLASVEEPCAAAVSLTAAPDNVTVNHTITLRASGLDPNDQSADVALTWNVTGSTGSLSASSGPAVTFLCTSVGGAAVTVTAAITDGGATCPKIGSLTAMLGCSPP